MVHTRDQAQQRADEILCFQRELARLEHENVLHLSDTQHVQVTHHHQQVLGQLRDQFDIDANLQSKRLSLGIKIVSLLGALALVISLLVFFEQFWDELATSIQLGLLLTCTFSTFAATWLLRRRDESGYFTQLAASLALASFVLNITLLGEIFNLPPSRLCFFIWGLYALMLAYACSSRLLLVCALILLVVFSSAELNHWADLPWLDITLRPENLLLPSILLLAIPQFISQQHYSGFAASYRLSGLITLLGSILVLSFWGDSSYLNLSSEWIEHGYTTVGFLLAALLIWLGIRHNWQEVALGAQAFFIIMLLANAVDWWWELLPHYLFFLLIGLLAIASLVALTRFRRKLAEMPK